MLIQTNFDKSANGVFPDVVFSAVNVANKWTHSLADLSQLVQSILSYNVRLAFCLELSSLQGTAVLLNKTRISKPPAECYCGPQPLIMPTTQQLS